MKHVQHIYVAVLAASMLGGVAAAHQGATGIVETRMEAMKDMADQMKLIGRMLQGQRDFDAEDASGAAEALSEHAASFPVYFPEGTNENPSEARDLVWEEWDEFSQLAGELEEKAENLEEIAASASSAADLKAGFRAVGGTCKSCHEQFRLD